MDRNLTKLLVVLGLYLSISALLSTALISWQAAALVVGVALAGSAAGIVALRRSRGEHGHMLALSVLAFVGTAALLVAAVLLDLPRIVPLLVLAALISSAVTLLRLNTVARRPDTASSSSDS